MAKRRQQTTPTEAPELWERLPNENAAHYDKFCAYRDMRYIGVNGDKPKPGELRRPDITIRRSIRGLAERTMATDKRGNPIVANGEVVWKVEKDNAKASRHMIVEALVYSHLYPSKQIEVANKLDLLMGTEADSSNVANL